MRRDARIRFTQVVEGKDVVILTCWAELDMVKPAPVELDDVVAAPDNRVRMKVHYVKALDPVLSEPPNYNIEFLDRPLPTAQVLQIQQMINRRYVSIVI